MGQELSDVSKVATGNLFYGRPRLFSCLGIAILVYLAAPFHGATRLLLAWNIGTWIYLVLALVMMARSDDKSIRWRATVTDDAKFVILILTMVAAVVALAAILVELSITKNLTGTLKGLHLALAGMTILSAWIFIHLSFALHYAHEYFDEHKSLEGETAKLRGGLEFPSTDDPDYWDFLYFSFVIGVAAQTADVAVSSKTMRRTALGHCVLAFFFNSAILALTINIAAGLI